MRGRDATGFREPILSLSRSCLFVRPQLPEELESCQGIDGGWESVAMEMLTGKPSLCHLGTLRWPQKERERERERDRSLATFGGFVILVRVGDAASSN